MIKKIALILCLCSIIIFGCKQDKCKGTSPTFHSGRFVLHSDENRKFEIHSFTGVNVPETEIFYGELDYTEDVVYAKYSKPKSIEKSVFFDFNLEIGESDSVHVNFESNDYLKKSYNLSLENKFYDKNIQDTVYSFRFEDFGISYPHDDLVFFVTQSHQVVGLYHGDKRDEGNVIYYFVGNIFGDKVDYMTNTTFDKLRL